jgi:membrane-bound lytic murein transglycosylase D
VATVGWWLVVAGLVLAPAGVVSAGAARDATFPRPASLEPQIRFWRTIFAERSVREVVLHDARDVGRVHGVLDFRDAGDDAAAEARRRRETDAALARLRARLARAQRRGNAVPVVRAQRGLRERFAEGLRTSGRYLPDMERIFRAEGLPVELARIPLIESSFDLRARSTAGAVGIWQLTRPTGRLFLRIDALVDERRDPLAATRAAARYLRRLHARLGTWPLAITAYNHGPTGVARAVRETGTRDLGTIVRRYRGPAFGFASRNFYAEFLAALDVERDAARWFGPLTREPPLRVREEPVATPVHVRTAARRAGVEPAVLATLNPALADAVLAGRRPIPAGYRLRLPAPAVAATYRVRRGDTLTRIARRHGTSVAALRRLNALDPGAPLRIGQRLDVGTTDVGG